MLLHTCCAACTLPIIKHLLKEKKVKNITLYFYNSNIYPKEEYDRRLKDVKEIAKIYKLKFVEGKYEHKKWLDYIEKSLSQSPEEYLENSNRCLSCFRFCLEETVKFARKNNFNEFATTLSVNRFKSVDYINQYAKELAEKNQLIYKTLDLDFNKAYKLGLQLTKKYGLYRQKYCGCEFSLKDML